MNRDRFDLLTRDSACPAAFRGRLTQAVRPRGAFGSASSRVGPWLVCVAAATVVSLGAVPVPQQPSAGDDWCRQQSWGSDREGVCEVREYSLPAGASPISVDAAPNGGIRIEGSPRSDVLVQARVVATAGSEQRAREIAAAVHVDAAAHRVTAQGPSGLGRHESWHVSYVLQVPTQTSLSLRTVNGGISIGDVEGQIEFTTVNGGVKLNAVGGDVRGRTTNGGVDVELEGPTWTGSGLDVETANGGVRLAIPEHYSARLETGTVNGGVRIDFPITFQGHWGREIAADLGAGGPLIRVRTRNGGVRITQK